MECIEDYKNLKAITSDCKNTKTKQTDAFLSRDETRYVFKVGDILVRAEFSEGLDFSDALVNALG